MAKINMDLSGNNVQKGSNYTLLPAGEYVVNVAKAEVKDSKAGGAYIQFDYEVTEGTMAGSLIKDIVNIVNASSEAERIGRDRLKTIATYSGHKNPNKIADTDELVGLKPFTVIVSVEEDGVYKNNRIKAILPNLGSEETPKEEPKKKDDKKRPWA